MSLPSGACSHENVCHQGLLVGVLDDPRPHLSRLSSHTPEDRRSVVAVGAVATAFVGASGFAGRIIGIWVSFTFFPLAKLLEHLVGLGMLIDERRFRLELSGVFL